jgi:hypothetical protein
MESVIMKKAKQCAAIILYALPILLTSNVQAQTNPKADFEKALIEEFCDSFAKAVPRLTRENWTGEIGMMIVPLFKKYESEIQAQWNFDTKDMSQYRSIGEKVGQLATLNCVAFQNYLKTNLNDVNAVVDGETGGRKMFSGKLLRVEGSPFAYVQAQNSQGRTDRFYWLGFFPGADKLTASESAYRNKTVVIYYREMEIYHPADKEYRTIKVITAMDL